MPVDGVILMSTAAILVNSCFENVFSQLNQFQEEITIFRADLSINLLLLHVKTQFKSLDGAILIFVAAI